MTVEEIPYGRRLMNNVIDERARSGHTRPPYSLPLGTHPKDGFRDVTYAMLARAIDRTCWLLDGHLGPSVDFDTFGWISSATDFRYLIFALAASKSRRKAFFPSPRNSIEAHLAVLDGCKCSTFLVSEASPPDVVGKLAKLRSIRLVQVPDLNFFLDDHNKETPPYPFDANFDQVRYDPTMVLHTSGSTGVPKCVYMRQGFFATHDAYRLFPRWGGSNAVMTVHEHRRVFAPMPNFHSAAMVMKLMGCIYYDSTVVEYPNIPLTPEGADAYHEFTNVTYTVLPPNILREIAMDEKLLKNTENLEHISSGGGPLAPGVGDKLSEKLWPVNVYGTTEFGQGPSVITDREDWMYCHFPFNSWCHFEHVAEDKYELVMRRDPKLDLVQSIFVTFPDLQEYHTKDLWSKHPTKPNLWYHRGRKDDVVVLENGEKFVPVSYEREIETAHEVNVAIVAGEHHFQPYLLIEPHEPVHNPEQRAELMKKLWPVIDSANSSALAHARIAEDFVLIASPDKPFVRTPKGTCQRKQTLQAYEHEVEELYQQNDPNAPSSQHIKSTLGSFEKTCSQLQDWISAHTHRAEHPGIDTDLFQYGLDSLGVMNLFRRINNAAAQQIVTSRIIYANPSIRQLANILVPSTDSTGGSPPAKSREDNMTETFDSLCLHLPLNIRTPTPFDPSQGATVILTGSTGSLGSYMLDALITHTTSPSPAQKVNKIICLNRGSDAASRQRRAQTDRALSTDFSRVQFLQTNDLSKPYLGLSNRQDYIALLRETTHVIHNAWPVDFNLSLATFLPHLRGVRNLIDFSAASAHNAAIHFLSSRATVEFPTYQPAPETINHDWRTSSTMGYAESKHVAEKLLAAAASHSHIPVSVSRIGQIAGPVLPHTTSSSTAGEAKAAMWPRREYMPSIVTSSRHLRKLPADLGVMSHDLDWTPVDVLAGVVTDITLGSPCGEVTTVDNEGPAAQVYHLTNPRRASWSGLLPTVKEHLERSVGPQGGEFKVLPYAQWFEALKASGESNGTEDASHTTNGDAATAGAAATTNGDASVADNPALKLLEFLASLLPPSPPQESPVRTNGSGVTNGQTNGHTNGDTAPQTNGSGDAEGTEQKGGYPVLDTTRAQERSTALRGLEAPGKEWMAMWMEQWGYT